MGRHRMDHGCGRLSTGKSDRLVSDIEKHQSAAFSPLLIQETTGKRSYLSLQHQFLGEKCCFLTEGLSLLNQAWEVSGSSGAFDACVRRKGELVMKAGP